MKISKKIALIVSGVVVTLGIVGIVRAATVVDLGTADDFAVLADTAISDAAPIGVITGDVGLGPTSGGVSITGLTSGQVSGTIYAMDAAGPDGGAGNDPARINQAKDDLTAAYNDANGQLPTTLVGDGDLGGGETLTPGVYSEDSTPDSLAITGQLTLDGGGDPNAVFIFQSDSTLITASNSEIILINGAQSCNVFWQVGSSATLGTNSVFAGTILALTSITDSGGSTVDGRLLARNGAVSLNNTDITVSTCAPALVLQKTVTNDNSGTALASAWTLTATGTGGSPTNLSGTTPVDSDVTFSDATFQADTYTLAESGGPSGYTASTYSCTKNGGSAVVSNSITLVDGDSAICTITNDDTGLPVSAATASSDEDSDEDEDDVAIKVTKTADPSALYSGPGSVTYTYQVTNEGDVPLRHVSVKDNKCSPVTFVSGDSNNNSRLGVDEKWIFTCTKTVSQTETNKATARGSASENGEFVHDTDKATVAVSVPGFPNAGVSP